MNTTPTNTDPALGKGMTFWKVLGIIAVALIALVLLEPIIKGLFWLAVIALAVYGGYMLLRSNKRSNTP